MIELKLPELGENIESAEVIRLLVSEGDVIKADQNVLELESEKAAFPLPTTHAGKVTKIRVKEGEAVTVGQALLDIEEAESAEAQPSEEEQRPAAREAKSEAQLGDGKKEAPTGKEKLGGKRGSAKVRPAKAEAAKEKEPPYAEPEKREEAEEEASQPEEEVGEQEDRKKENRPKEPSPKKEAAPERARHEVESRLPAAAGPATRRLARELGVDIHDIIGSEPGGRITREDVKAYVRQRLGAAPRGLEVPPLPDFGRWGTVKRQRLNRLNRTAAERLSLAWRAIPHVTQHELADITDLEAARVQYNQNLVEGKPKITVTVLAIQAAVSALRTFPQFNSSFDPTAGELIVKEYYHIGVAVDTEQGLLVPVLRDADRKRTVELAAELAELAQKARDRALAPEEMQGGTFTITNLGGIGGTAFTPIINYPEVAILGISRSRWEEVPRDGTEARRLLLPLSLSYDHRVINGADGARFVLRIAQLLSSAFELLVEL
jgi:pyruvate dehydrogenase E2 component (dihydrolipoamide acetyltransferase)